MTRILASCLLAGMATTTALAQTSSPTTQSTTPSATTGSTNTGNTNATTGTTGATSTTANTGQAAPAGGWYRSQNSEMRASKIIGATVRNNAGDNIGEINEVLLDGRGQVVAIVIGVGGFLGLGEREVAISPQGYQMSRDSNGDAVVMVNANAEALRSAPPWQSN